MSTRETILHTIKAQPKASVDELAEAAEVSPVTVRHHLNALMADSLIVSESVRRKVGRPYYVYRLSEKGQELFPQRYVRLTTRLLAELKAHLPPEAVQDVFSNVVDSILDKHRGSFEDLEFEDRLDFLVTFLAEEGFLAHWERIDDGYLLTEYSCPYLSLGEEHAEICSIDKQLIVNVLESPVEQKTCMLAGGECCQFVVPLQAVKE